MKSKIYDPKALASKWSKKWQGDRLYEVDIKGAANPFYNLMMFPYPSAEGLHVGNMYAFTGADVFGRFNRMQGKDVLEPIGLDGFGIHSENYAIKIGKHPREQAEVSQKNFYNQLSMIGNGFSWENKLETYDPTYYRWTQWLFIQMFKRGLAYKKESWVNWCPSCKTVLADEQVENGKCERCKNEVVRKEVSAWHFKITEYADRLLSNIEEIDWPEMIKTAQRQWIGRKEGARVTFSLDVPGQEEGKHKVEVFTTRLDTIFGVTFLVISPEMANSWMEVGWKPDGEVQKYVKTALNKTEQERRESKEKTGVKTEVVAINPINGVKVPVFVADYVLSDVGTGAVMGVPAHDERDAEFAEKHGLEVIEVVKDGKLVNSGEYDGLRSEEAVKKMLSALGEAGEREINYHLRDWIISRQRYWGPPIPMTKCDECGWQPVLESELPVALPEIDDFKPKGDGSSPLSNAPESWKKTKCSKCGGEATRELDVSDTFLDSSWYFLAYPHMRDGEWTEGEPFSDEVLKKWLPVDAYIGGAEHAVLHLLYARFVTMVLFDMGKVAFEEPFPFLFGHGLIIKDGAKMSKSRGNVINPDEYIKRFGADALRTYLMFLGSYDQGGDFRDTGMAGMYRFIERVWKLVLNEKKRGEASSELVTRKLHKTIKKVGEDLSRFSYNTAIAAIMELVNVWKQKGEAMSKEDVLIVLQLLAPIAPFMTEELWGQLGGEGSIHKSLWPEFDESKTVDDVVEIPVQVNGKHRATITIGLDKAEDEEVVMSLARADEKVSGYIDGKEFKVVFIPGRLVNLVV